MERIKKLKDTIAVTDSGGVTISHELIGSYLEAAGQAGRSMHTIKGYRRSLEDLYDYLPPDKRVTPGMLDKWAESITADGYSASTVNARITAANNLLRYCGCRKAMGSYANDAKIIQPAALSADELAEFLASLRRAGKLRECLMAEVFAFCGIRPSDMTAVTVEACREKKLSLSGGGEVMIPALLAEELLRYAKAHGRTTGPVFLTKKGNVPDRANTTNALRKVAQTAGFDPSRCGARALQRYYEASENALNDYFERVFAPGKRNTAFKKIADDVNAMTREA